METEMESYIAVVPAWMLHGGCPYIELLPTLGAVNGRKHALTNAWAINAS